MPDILVTCLFRSFFHRAEKGTAVRSEIFLEENCVSCLEKHTIMPETILGFEGRLCTASTSTSVNSATPRLAATGFTMHNKISFSVFAILWISIRLINLHDDRRVQSCGWVTLQKCQCELANTCLSAATFSGIAK